MEPATLSLALLGALEWRKRHPPAKLAGKGHLRAPVILLHCGVTAPDTLVAALLFAGAAPDAAWLAGTAELGAGVHALLAELCGDLASRTRSNALLARVHRLTPAAACVLAATIIVQMRLRVTTTAAELDRVQCTTAYYLALWRNMPPLPVKLSDCVAVQVAGTVCCDGEWMRALPIKWQPAVARYLARYA
jgi:hypothetical protein